MHLISHWKQKILTAHLALKTLQKLWGKFMSNESSLRFDNINIYVSAHMTNQGIVTGTMTEIGTATGTATIVATARIPAAGTRGSVTSGEEDSIRMAGGTGRVGKTGHCVAPSSSVTFHLRWSGRNSKILWGKKVRREIIIFRPKSPKIMLAQLLWRVHVHVCFLFFESRYCNNHLWKFHLNPPTLGDHSQPLNVQ